LASMPRSDTTKPRSIPLGTPKTHFSGFSFTPCCRSFTKTSVRSGTRSHVLFYDAAYQLPEDASHASLESCARILEPEGHRLITVLQDMGTPGSPPTRLTTVPDKWVRPTGRPADLSVGPTDLVGGPHDLLKT
jgi:hypothetical protein